MSKEQENKKEARLDKYILLDILGEGYTSEVRLALNVEDGKKYALKIMGLNHQDELFSKIDQIWETEVNSLTKLNHSNIIKLHEAKKNAILTDYNGHKFIVSYLALEYIRRGELFDYIKAKYNPPQPIVRYYFHQLIQTLQYLHEMGICHRDLKLENILLDDYFNLKIMDFGFSTELNANGTEFLTQYLGTKSYMAPEIHLRLPYKGDQADIFSAGVLLFILFAGNPPFYQAKRTDYYYKMLMLKRTDYFWAFHSKSKPKGFFSHDFKDLVSKMLAADPNERISLTEIEAHPWYNGKVASLEEVMGFFLKEHIKREYNEEE